jgi:hypothetical protein
MAEQSINLAFWKETLSNERNKKRERPQGQRKISSLR